MFIIRTILASGLLAACCITSAAAQEKGQVQAEFLNEISGLSASFTNKGLLYVHNDSGDTSRFFLISPDGALKAIYTFKGNPQLRTGVVDCEDMAVGAGNVYIGDIGDNAAWRPFLTVYRMPEPVLKASKRVVTTALNAAPLYLRYPDGPRDAETIMVDPIEKLLYIVSKREDSVKVYTTPLAFKAGDTVTLTHRATLFFDGKKIDKQITSGSISHDGQQVLLKNYAKVYYWKRNGHEPVWQLLTTPPREMPYQREPQGEAIGFTINGKGYYTISEGEKPPVYYYETPQ